MHRRRMRLLHLEIKRHVFRRRHARTHRLRPLQNRRAILALAQQRPHVDDHIAHEPIGQNRLQPITNLDTILPVFDRKHQHEAVVLPLVADAPPVKKIVGKILDGLAVERIDGYQRHLDAGGLFQVCSSIVPLLRATPDR